MSDLSKVQLDADSIDMIKKFATPEVIATLQEVQKAAETVSTNTFSPDDRSIFSPENLDEKIKLTVPGKSGAVMRQRLPRTPSMGGEAAAWKRLTTGLNTNVGTVVGGTNTTIFFADAGAPSETTQTYTYTTAKYKLLGRKLEVGMQAIAASRGRDSGYATVRDERLETAKMTEVILGEEEGIISGSSAVNANAFDGLGVQITTNSGTTSLLSVSGIGTYEKTLYDLGSSGATLLLCSSFQLQALGNQLEGSGSIVRIMQDMGTGRVNAGSGRVVGIISPITGNTIDVEPSRYVGGNAYLLTEFDVTGEPWIEMEDQIPMSRMPVPSSNFSTIDFIVEATVLKVIGEPYQYELAGLATS
jgi:hypothetical protein